MILEKMPASWQAAIALLAQPVLKRIGVEYDMNRVYSECGVGRTSAFDAARLISRAIEEPRKFKDERAKNFKLDKELRLTKFHNDVFRFLQEHPDAWMKGEERHQFSDDFKMHLVLKKKEYDLEWGEIAKTLDIPEETLKKFKHQVESKNPDDEGGGGSLKDLPEAIVEKLRAFFQGRESKATVKDFTKKHPEVLEELKMGYAEFASLLLKLGFTSPKGIFLNNTGLDKIVRFEPHVVWGTDGKHMKVVINGEIFHFVWQCLIDYKSTVLVGGLVGESETTVNLLGAIRRAKENHGLQASPRPMAIVIDGRLSENLPAIRQYLDEMGIEIIRTFPGNPKSNGIIEGNFNIFEKWVGGKVQINGETAEEVAFSIAEMLTEVFTQLRNNSPRRALHQKTANEVINQAPKLSKEDEQTIRLKISALANRFKNEQAVPVVKARKQDAINQAIDLLNPPDAETFRKRLSAGMFTADLILDAIAKFKIQRDKHPEKTFDHTYFGGILRNLVDQRSVEMLCTELEQTYSEHWARMVKVMNENRVQTETVDAMCERLVREYLESTIPAHGWITLSHLQSAFLLAVGQSVTAAEDLRQRLTTFVTKSRLECANKRKRLLRKIFFCEAFVKQMNLAAAWNVTTIASAPAPAL
jgi:hypothetical protein